MTEITNPVFIKMFCVTYTPLQTQLGRYQPPQDFYFSKIKTLNAFLEDNEAILPYMKTYEAMALRHEGNIYPLGKPLLVGDGDDGDDEDEEDDEEDEEDDDDEDEENTSSNKVEKSE